MKWQTSLWGTSEPFNVLSVSVHPGNCKKEGDALILFRVPTPSMREEQEKRANDLCDYLNMLEEAKAEAIKNTTIATAVAKRMSSP